MYLRRTRWIMKRYNPAVLTAHEQNEPEWWCRHHKESTKYLTYRLKQLLDGTPETKASIEVILRAHLIASAKEVDLELDDVDLTGE